MDSKKESCKGMINPYLYCPINIIDRLGNVGGHVLRSGNKTAESHGAASRGKDNNKKDEMTISRLEQEMDELTDPRLLRAAREDQQGQRTLPPLA
jgi:hypothetical protein